VPISDLLGIRARTASGVEVATPTVRSLLRALTTFQEEIGNVVAAIAQSPDGAISPEAAAAYFVASRTDGRLKFVLDGLVDPVVLERDSTTREAILALIAISGANLRGVAALLKPHGEPTIASEADDTDPLVRRLLLIGVRAGGIDPVKVLDWPMGLFLDALREFLRSDGDELADKRAEMLASLAPAPERVPIVGGPTYPDGAK